MMYNSIVVLDLYIYAAFLFLRWPVIGLFSAIYKKANRLLKKFIKIFFETLDLAFKYDLIDTERFTSMKKGGETDGHRLYTASQVALHYI